MDSKFANVYKTDNYKKFKKMLDNREVSKQRITSIIRSIEAVGYIPSPIIVNEKFEVIDGQGRLAAAEQKKLPVYYVMVKGIGIDECRAMNLHQSNWTVKDFIHSYAASGNQNYINQLNLLKEFEKTLGANTLYSIGYGKYFHSAGILADVMKSGKLEFNEKEYEKARQLCTYLCEFSKIMERIGGRKDIFYGALRYMLTVPGCDKDALKKRVHRNQASLIPAANIEQALMCLEDCYNFHMAKKVYFASEYRKLQDKQNLERRKAVGE